MLPAIAGGGWEYLCISIPGKRDMMMTPMDFYASITPDCNKFGVSGCYCPGFQWKFMEPRIDRPSNEISTSQAMAGVHVTVPEAEVAAGTLSFLK